MADTKSIIVRGLTDKQHKELKHLAIEKDSSMSELVLGMIIDHLKETDKNGK